MSKTRTDRPNRKDRNPDTISATRFSRPTIAAGSALPRLRHHRGDLSDAPLASLRSIGVELWPAPNSRRVNRNRGLYLLTEYLLRHPGSTWQERWDASELNTLSLSADQLTTSEAARAQFGQALGAMFALRVIQPTLAAFKVNKLMKFTDQFVIAEADHQLDSYIAAVRVSDSTETFKVRAVIEVCTALTVQGIPFADLTPEAFLHHAMVTRQSTSRTGLHTLKYIGHLAWQVLHSTGHFPPTAPSTLRGALRSPQLTTTEMVDRHRIANPEVRQMFIDYFDRRASDVKYSSLANTATILVGLFWKTIEQINPDQSDLRVADEHYQQWRATLAFRADGTPRSGPWVITMAVQALYYDIQAWAIDEPERWARWSAPCPVPRSDVRAQAAHKRRVQEKTHDQIRVLQPLLPVLVDYVDQRNQHWRRVLELASAANHDEQFDHDGHSYTRVITRGDTQLIEAGDPPGVHVRSPRFGRTVDVALYEDAAFWVWAIIETLRYSGIRIEELTELS
ncbi:hypothetical protein, partial [Rhodococcus sp. H29-C3]|uniref:hypothetical protein n=1 Tax=Rhodococcus sp. H29-C3 TaxID=3046307 RepID=UPI0024B9651C